LKPTLKAAAQHAAPPDSLVKDTVNVTVLASTQAVDAEAELDKITVLPPLDPTTAPPTSAEELDTVIVSPRSSTTAGNKDDDTITVSPLSQQPTSRKRKGPPLVDTTSAPSSIRNAKRKASQEHPAPTPPRPIKAAKSTSETSTALTSAAEKTFASAAKDTIDVVPKRAVIRSFDQPTASSKAKKAGAGGKEKENVKTTRSGRNRI